MGLVLPTNWKTLKMFSAESVCKHTKWFFFHLTFSEVLQEPWWLVLGKAVFQKHDWRAVCTWREKTRTKNHRGHSVTWVYKVFIFLLKLNSIKHLLFFFLWGTNFGGQGMILDVFSESLGTRGWMHFWGLIRLSSPGRKVPNCWDIREQIFAVGKGLVLFP